MNVPKKIWLLWRQGLAAAPAVVQKCYRSWRVLNPDYELVLLTSENLADYCPQVIHPLLQDPGITTQSLSDIVRINLLTEHGGVWVDATCYCARPLNEWLPAAAATGFFAFSSPPELPMAISSWFLAGHPENYLVRSWRDRVNAFWLVPRRPVAWNKRWYTRLPMKALTLNKVLDRRPRWWMHPLVTRTLGLHAYFWFHYLFTLALEEDPRFQQAWKQVPTYLSTHPHQLQRNGITRPPSAELRQAIMSKAIRVHKLDWRAGEVPEDSALALLERVTVVE